MSHEVFQCVFVCGLPCPLPLWGLGEESDLTWTNLKYAHSIPGLISLPLNLVVLFDVCQFIIRKRRQSSTRRKKNDVMSIKILTMICALCGVLYTLVHTLPTAIYGHDMTCAFNFVAI